MADGLVTAFIANNSGNNVLICASPDGINWTNNTDIHQASNGSAPSLASFNNKLWAAFIANNSGNNVLVCESADGVSWSNNTDIHQASNGSAPSLASFNNKLWIAFIANNSGNNVLVCSYDPQTGKWSNDTDINQASNGSAPSLASFNGKLWVAFISNNSDKKVLVCSYDPQTGSWSSDTDINQASNGSAPSLAVFNGKLWVAFIANNSGNNVLVCSYDPQTNSWSSDADIKQASNGSAPSLTVFNGKLWVAFIANNSGNNVLVCFRDVQTNSWSNNTDIQQASNGSAPSLASFDAPAPTNFGLRMQYQLTKEWCWIATATSINHFYDPASTLTQCQLMTEVGQQINHYPSNTSACPSAQVLASNSTLVKNLANLYVPAALYALEGFVPTAATDDYDKTGGVGDPLKINGNCANYPGQPSISLAQLSSEIAAKRPVAIDFAWSNGNGQHVVTVVGQINGQLYVCDPIYGESIVQYGVFPGGYQGVGGNVVGVSLTQKS